MHGGDDGGIGEEALDFDAGEVGDADSAGFGGLFEDTFHGFVGVDVVRVAGLDLAVGGFGHGGFPAREGAGPVHEVEVNVVGAQVGERGIKGSFDVVRMVTVVPEFGRDEELGAWNAGFADGGASGAFGAISLCCVRCLRLVEGNQNGAHILAVSMCRKPVSNASVTAFCWASLSCQVPKPVAGMSAPVLSFRMVPCGG